MGEAIARIDELRNRFTLARKQLESLPETGLSEDGLPFIGEVAEALQSFAAWFGQCTLDNVSLWGSAWKVHDALNGHDAIVDWVGLHRSQQFANDIREHAAELFKQSEALDEAVLTAFTVKLTPVRVLSRNRRIPQSKRDTIEDGIREVASLAGHLGVRLKRIALMTDSAAKKQIGRSRGRGGRPQNDEALARDLLTGWKAFEPEDGRKTKERYLAQRPDVRTLKTEEAKQRKIASLRVALDSALHLCREKTKQKRRARG